MSVFKTTFSRALRAHPSDSAVIASPNTANVGGATTSAATNKLINSSAKFSTASIYPGDVVHNDTAGTCATVVSIDSDTQLTLNANIFTTSGQAYVVYSMSPQAGIGQTGAYLYVAVTGNVSVITIGGDIATFAAVPAGTVLPVQVLQLRATSTTSTNVMALW
jgi:hypothetical protein